MRVAYIQITPWDKPVPVSLGDLTVKIGDEVIINVEYGLDAGKIVAIRDEEDAKIKKSKIGVIDRVADSEDLETICEYESEKQESKKQCQSAIKRHGLEMKLVDCHFSFDGRRLTFSFIADGRVDFRELVKDLTRHFQKIIRLHQLGVRDEVKMVGDVGCCGRELCCRGCLTELVSVTSEYAEQQQVAHRGSERLSGICGRLKCCLAYEKDLYEELEKKLPAVGTKVRTKHGRGEVIHCHTLKGSVDVRLAPEKDSDESAVVEVVVDSQKH